MFLMFFLCRWTNDSVAFLHTAVIEVSICFTFLPPAPQQSGAILGGTCPDASSLVLEQRPGETSEAGVISRSYLQGVRGSQKERKGPTGPMRSHSYRHSTVFSRTLGPCAPQGVIFKSCLQVVAVSPEGCKGAFLKIQVFSRPLGLWVPRGDF